MNRIHGVMLTVGGSGVLLSGPAGSGKSALALALLHRGHRLVADDAVDLRRSAADQTILLASCPPPLRALLLVRGLGVIDLREHFGPQAVVGEHPLDLEIRLCPATGPQTPLTDPLNPIRRRRLLGVSLPWVELAAGGADPVAWTETAAREQRLRRSANRPDAAAELRRRQRRLLRSDACA